jgi:hypothetical protein
MTELDKILNADDVVTQCGATGDGSLCQHFGLTPVNAQAEITPLDPKLNLGLPTNG